MHRGGEQLGSDAAAEVQSLYARIELELGPHQSLCRRRGVCCDFRVAEHQLFTTEVELRYFLTFVHPGPAEDPCLCPVWDGQSCLAHSYRPLGCRTFFCDPSWKGRGEAIYERYHRELCEVGERHHVPYRYESWTCRLKDLLRPGAGGRPKEP